MKFPKYADYASDDVNENGYEGVPYWRAHWMKDSPNQWMIQSVIWVQLAWAVIALTVTLALRCGCKSQGYSGMSNRGMCIGLALVVYLSAPVITGCVSFYTMVDDPKTQSDQLQSVFYAFLIITVINFSLVSLDGSLLSNDCIILVLYSNYHHPCTNGAIFMWSSRVSTGCRWDPWKWRTYVGCVCLHVSCYLSSLVITYTLRGFYYSLPFATGEFHDYPVDEL